MSLRIKKNDTVYVNAGKDKGKTGRVLFVIPKKDRAIVEGVNTVKKHTKQRSQDVPGGIVTKEAGIRLSNLMIVCGKCGRGVRFGVKVNEDGTKDRICKKCNTKL